MDIKTVFNRVWHFLWHEDSVWAWIANIVVAFILIKFVIYPLAGLILGTSLPVVAVVSGSMEHGPSNGMLCGTTVGPDADWWETCGDWYEMRGISMEEFEQFPFSKGFDKGDIIVLLGAQPEELSVGDVLVFAAGKQYPIIHRIVNTTDTPEGVLLATKGDHNPAQISEYVLVKDGVGSTCAAEMDGELVPAPCGFGSIPVTADTPGATALLDERGITEDRIIGRAVGRIPYVGWVKIWFVDLLSALR